MPSQLSISLQLKLTLSFQSALVGLIVNTISHVINPLLAKLALDCTGRMLTLLLHFLYSDLAVLSPYCQDLRPILSHYSPHNWFIRCIYKYIMSARIK